MDILQVVQGYTPAIGGTELQIQRISEELVYQFNDRVTVFTSDCYNAGGFVNPRAPRLPTGWEKINGVQVRRFRTRSQLGPVLKPMQWLAFKLDLPFNEYLRVWYGGPHLLGLSRAIRESQAELISVASFPLMHMFTALKTGRKSNRPVVLVGNQHPEDAWGFHRPMIASAVRQSGAYIANTEYETQYVIDHGAAPDRVFTIGCGVDPEPFLASDQVVSRSLLGIPQGIPIIGFIGQLGRLKGVDTVLRAMPAIWEAVPQAGLLLAGSQTSFQPRLEALLEQISAEHRQKIHIIYNFNEAQKKDLFAALDLFAYPSGYESFGIAYLEAWAAGKPVIGCRRGAVPWVVTHEKDGLLIEYQDQTSLTTAAVALLQNRELACRMGEAGRKKVFNQFTWPLIARQYRDVYQQVACAGPRT